MGPPLEAPLSRLQWMVHALVFSFSLSSGSSNISVRFPNTYQPQDPGSGAAAHTSSYTEECSKADAVCPPDKTGR